MYAQPSNTNSSKSRKKHDTNAISPQQKHPGSLALKPGSLFPNHSHTHTVQRKNTAKYLNPTPTGIARHHIIPDTVLKTFIQRVRIQDSDVFRQLIQAVETAYIIYHSITPADIEGVTPENFRTLPDTIRNRFLILLAITKTSDPGDYENEMQEAFIWSPGNLVFGPINRDNDPQDEFDLPAAFNAGIPLGSPRNASTATPATGAFALGDALSMMLLYNTGIIAHPIPEIIRTILIPHILSGIHDGRGGDWTQSPLQMMTGT